MKAVPKIPAKHWFWRNSLEVLKDPLAFFKKTFHEHGDIYDVNSNIYTIYIISNPDLIQEVLQSKAKQFSKSDDYKILKHSLGNGLLTSEGEFWKKQRRIAQPAFYKESLRKLVATIIEDTNKFVDKWQHLQEVEVHHEMMLLTQEIVTNALFGTELHVDAEQIQENITIGNEFLSKKIMTPFSLPIWFPTKASRQYHKSRRYNNRVITEVIENRRQDKKEYHDLLAMLMHAKDEETGETMSNQQLKDEAITIFVAGHETTANAMSWAFYLMAKHPDKQEKVRQEAIRVLGEDNQLSFEKLRELEYTQMVINETMRLYPPAWSMGRKAIDDVEVGGYEFKKNATVLIDIYMTHRHTKYWDKPEDFIPERFTDEEKKKRHKLSYMPFGAGQRMCIGNNFAMMEMQVILALLLKNFTISLAKKSEIIAPEPLVTLRPKTDIHIQIKSNNQTD